MLFLLDMLGKCLTKVKAKYQTLEDEGMIILLFKLWNCGVVFLILGKKVKAVKVKKS